MLVDRSMQCVRAGSAFASLDRLEELADKLGGERADLGDVRSLAYNDGRVRRNDELDQAIQSWAGRQTLQQVPETLHAADVPAAESIRRRASGTMRYLA